MKSHRIAVLGLASLFAAVLLEAAPCAQPVGRAAVESRLAFVGPYASGYPIYLINPDGSGLQPTGLAGYSVDLRPDLLKLALGGVDGALYTANVDGTGILPVGALGSCPKWSPDGSRLLFIAAGSSEMRDRSSGGGGLLSVVNADGTNPRSLGVVASDADWSPAGDRAVFAPFSYWLGSPSELSLIGADGSSLEPLGLQGHYPRWSPEGTRIAFLSSRATGPTVSVAQLGKARSVTSVVDLPVHAYGLAWSPDGTKLVFVSSGDSPGLFTINADGTGTPQPLGVAGEWVAWRGASGPSFSASQLTVEPTGATVAEPAGTLTVTLVVKNDGPGAATNVVVVDPLPQGVQYQQSSLSLDGEPQTEAKDGDAADLGVTNPGAFTVALGQVPPNASRVIMYQCTVTGAAGLPIHSEASIRSAELPPQTVLAGDLTVTGPDFRTSAKEVDNRAPEPGGVIEYRLHVTNTGNAAARVVTVDDNLPPCTEYVPGSLRVEGKPQSDGAGDDQAEFLPGAPPLPPRVRFHLLAIDVGSSPLLLFRVKAVCAAGAVVNNSAMLSAQNGYDQKVDAPPVVISDFTSPAILHCGPYNNQLVVEFSEEVKKAQAEEPSNWELAVTPPGSMNAPSLQKLPPGAVLQYTPGVPATGGQPAVAPKVLVLGLALQTGAYVGVRARGIEDLANPPNMISSPGDKCAGAVKLAPGASLAMAAGDNQTAVAGAVLSQPIVVKVVDVDGRPVPGVTVRFLPKAGIVGPVVPGRQAMTGPVGQVVLETGAAGEARVEWTLGPASGSQELSVRADGDGSLAVANSPQTFHATAISGNATGLTLAADPARAPVGGSVRVIAAVLDEYGNAVPGIDVTLATTAGKGTLDSSGQAVKTNARGAVSAMLSGLSYGVNTITAAADALSPASTDVLGQWELRLSGGLQLFTVPVVLQDADPAKVFGLPADYLRVARYGTATEDWEVYPGVAFGLEPGRGYFGRFQEPRVASLTAGQPLPEDKPVDLAFSRRGWHLLGNPRLGALPWNLGEIGVLQSGAETARLAAYVSGPSSVSRPVEPYLWVYDRTQSTSPYRLVFDAAYLSHVPAALRGRVVPGLAPGQGAWALVNAANCGYRLPAVTQSSARAAVPAAVAPKAAAGEWSVELAASCGDLRDDCNVIGAAASAFQLAEPPVVTRSDGGYLSLSLTPSAETRADQQPLRLAADVRAAVGQRAAWEAVVRTNRQNEVVTVQWPALGEVPRQYRLYVTDTETGKRQAMRTTASYSFRANATGTTERRLLVEAETGAQSRLQISNVTAQPGSRGIGASLAYTLSQEAACRISVRSAAGRTVRVLGPQQNRAGLNLVQWDGRSAAGQALPRGAYLVEIVAENELHERARAISAVTVR